MRKRLCFATILCGFTFSIQSVFAAPSASLSVSKGQIEVGQSVTATITAKNVATWQIYSFSGVGNTNGCSISEDNKIGYNENANNQTKTFKITCTANSTGQIKFSYSGFFADSSYNKITPSDKKYVTVVAARPKSTNNYLKSLSVEGGTISPDFNKDTLEYTTVFEPGTEKVVINAEKEDGYASLNGTGEHAVVEGENKFEISVTSETGSTRTYVLTVTVKEYDPIIVKVDGKNLTVVRKLEELTKPESFTETTVQIGEDNVPAFYNEVTKKTLVGLKDEDGKVYLYEYNDGKYTRYYEFTFTQLTLNIIKMDKSLLPSGYSKYTETINGEKLEVYKYSKSSNFAVVYGIDVTTGKKKLYQIDLKNNTVQEFNDELIKKLDDTKKNSLIIFAIGAGVIFLEFLIILASKKKRKKILNKIKNDKIEKVKEKAIQEAKEETISINIDDVKKEIKKEEEIPEEVKKEKKKVKKEKKSK